MRLPFLTESICSFLLTLVNIACIIVTGVIILKVKEVTSDKLPKLEQRNQSFWKKDVKNHRDYNRTLYKRGGNEDAGG